jgi:hypothetical protein
MRAQALEGLLDAASPGKLQVPVPSHLSAPRVIA